MEWVFKLGLFLLFCFAFFPAFREMIKKSYKIEAFLRANFKDDQTILMKRQNDPKVGMAV